MGTFLDRTGCKFGRLTVISRDDSFEPKRGVRVKWICRCDCGSQISATGHALQRGDTSSCGCFRAELTRARMRTHGQSKSPTYNTWRAMRERCGLTGDLGSAAYAKQGVIVCDDWSNSFETFKLDMGDRPKGKTLDRIDPFKGYYPENCRWASASVQSGNKRSNVLYQGRRASIAEIARCEGLKRSSLQKRIKVYGDTPEQAVAHLKAL